MNESHEESSSRLRAYSQGALDEVEAAEVEAHLAACPGCTRELGVVRLLLTTTESSMDDLERATLHRDVRSAVIVPAPARRERWGRRLAPALGAAALLAVIAVGVVSLDRDPSPSDTSNTTTDIADAEAPAAEEADRHEATTGRTMAGQASDVASGSDAGSGGGSAGGDAALPEANSKPAAGTIQAPGIAGAPRARAMVTVVQRSFSAASFDRRALVRARANTDALRFSLHSSAPAGRVRDVIRRCVETTLATSPLPLRPAMATVYRADDIVVITFLWDDASGALNYEIRGWRGGVCDRPSPIYRRGTLG